MVANGRWGSHSSWKSGPIVRGHLWRGSLVLLPMPVIFSLVLSEFLLTQVIKSLESGLLWAGLPEATVQMLVAYDGWRIMMMLGTLPAVLTFFFRIFVPESERWLEEKRVAVRLHVLCRSMGCSHRYGRPGTRDCHVCPTASSCRCGFSGLSRVW